MKEKPLVIGGEAAVVSLADEARFAANGIVSRTILSVDGVRVVLFGFAEGQELSEHTTPKHALVEVLSGECDFTLAGKGRRLKAGDWIYMPPGLPHAVKALTEFSMLLTLFPAKPAEAAAIAPGRS